MIGSYLKGIINIQAIKAGASYTIVSEIYLPAFYRRVNGLSLFFCLDAGKTQAVIPSVTAGIVF